MQPVNMAMVLETVTNSFSDMLVDDSRKIKLVIEPVASRTAYAVIGNDGRLCQVFTNLIDNALSFSPDGGTITIRARPNGSSIEVAVEDQGPGIPPDKLGAIFERFYSDRPATDAKRGKNSGLGLSISREIVISLRGDISAENRNAVSPNGGLMGAGARFVVRLPAAGDTGGGLGRRS